MSTAGADTLSIAPGTLPVAGSANASGAAGTAKTGSALRFELRQPLFEASGVVSYWRAVESRSGSERVVRVIEAPLAAHPRLLEQLHRERALAEQLDNPNVLRTQVPQVEGSRIIQAVEPAPARLAGFDPDQRMSTLKAVMRIAEILALLHARGTAHGALATPGCLVATAAGDVLVTGFVGGRGSAHDLQLQFVQDREAFLDLADALLAPSGGPPARLRAVFETGEPLARMEPAAAMAWLRDELRESLEDTFPWPVISCSMRPQRPSMPPVQKVPAAVASPAANTAAATTPRAPESVRESAAPGTPAPAPGSAALPTPAAVAAYPLRPPAAAADEAPDTTPRKRRWLAAAIVLLLIGLAVYSGRAWLANETNAGISTATPATRADTPLERQRAIAAALAEAEARLRAGQTSIARAWFEHVLQLDPSNARARQGARLAAAGARSGV